VAWVEQTGSTNADLLTLARDGGEHGLVLVADHQSSGRGRLGRTWSAPPGGALLCSVLLRPPPGAVVHGGVWAMALAARAAVRDAAGRAGEAAEIKWPNDVMVGDRKLAGILAEAATAPDRAGTIDAIVVGIGLNVGWVTAPPDVAARAVTLEELSGRSIERRALLLSLLCELAPLLALWAAAPDALVARYRAGLGSIGRMVRVTLPDREEEGEAVDVTAEGALVVMTAGGPVTVSAGDVVHLRPV
jgi:BirA family biotin operon repressor/biotin-[acetyl-CoA-carboxylase] ligase